MSDIPKASTEEASTAFWVAHYAKNVVEKFIEKGRPNAFDFISLCESIRDLENKTIGAISFIDRAEELYELQKEEEKAPSSDS